MGKCRFFEIQLDNDTDHIFHPGEVVRGRCVVELSKGIRIKTFGMTFNGRASTSWKELKTGKLIANGKWPTFEYTASYCDSYEYFNHSQDMTLHDGGRFSKAIPAGRFEFPFAFQLPTSGISSSFKNWSGSIRYVLNAEIGRPDYRWTRRYRTSQTINVMVPINRSYNELMSPVVGNKVETMDLHGKSGRVLLNVHTDRTGYSLGDVIKLTGIVDNCSSRTVIASVALWQTVRCNAQDGVYVNSDRLRSDHDEFVESGKSLSWNQHQLTVPKVGSSVLDSHLIRNEYHVRVTLDSLCATKLVVDLPICIGLMPVPPHREPREFIECANAELGIGDDASAPAYTEVAYEDPPPSYAQSWN